MNQLPPPDEIVIRPLENRRSFDDALCGLCVQQEEPIGALLVEPAIELVRDPGVSPAIA
jgi:hypothetical protein